MMKKDTIGILAVLVVVMVLGGLGLTTANAQTYPILKLDWGADHVASKVELGFTAFTTEDSGKTFDGITITLSLIDPDPSLNVTTAPAWNLRDRGGWSPTGIPYELLYRDHIFSRPGGIRITLEGLKPNESYEITIWAWDIGSAGDRIADWYANDVFCLTTYTNSSDPPVDETSNRYIGTAQSDDTGTIVLESYPNENTNEQSGANNPYAIVAGFMISAINPITEATDPVPEDGATAPSTAIRLEWVPGMLSSSSNVYFGETFEDVNNATTTDPAYLDSTTEGFFLVGSEEPYPTGLTVDKTYYWRIDAVGSENVWKGKVWSFYVPPKTASNPSPVNGSLFAEPNFLDPDVILSWYPAADATSYHVYFGDDLDAVQAGTGGTDQGTVTDPNYDPNSMLEFDKTYYLRVDASDGTTTYPGEVWSFTTTIEGLGRVGFDMWENIDGATLDNLEEAPAYPDNPTWSDVLTEFATADSIGDDYGARIYGWLYAPLTGDYTFWLSCADEGELWLSTDDEPENVQLLAAERVWGWYNAFSHQSDPIPLIGGNKYYIMAIWKENDLWDHCQVAWQGAGIRDQEIIQGCYLSPYEPVIAFGEVPHDGDTNIKQTPTLSWKPGKYAASSNLYFGLDPNSLNQIATRPLGSEYYKIATHLQNNQTYYWRIDEVNSLHPDGPWIGEVWSFTVANYTVLDDFEDYNDTSPDRIFDTWKDGWGVATNGSQVGYGTAPFAERTIVNSGLQSMPFFYNNTGSAAYSEAVRSFDAPLSDWTREGVQTLTLFFRGYPAEFVEDPDGTYAMSAGGEDIWDDSDQFRYAYKMLSGNGSITARVVSVENTNEWAKAGVMIRDTLDGYSVHAFMCATPSNRRSFQNRQIIAETSFQANSDANAITLPLWVRVVRQGNNFTGYYSYDNITWIQQPDDENTGDDASPNPVTIVMSQNIYIGLAYTSHNTSEMGTAVFEGVETTGTVIGDDWQVEAIGVEMPSNDPAPLYIAVQGGGTEKVVEHPDDPNAVLQYTWQQWDIPLSVFSDAGVNLSAIQKMTIGVGSEGQNGAGKLYFDDIRLYPLISEPDPNATTEE